MVMEVIKKIKTKQSVVSMIVRVCALILLIFFFLPTIGISCEGEKIADISGIGAATGTVLVENSSGEKEKADDVNAAVWLFIMPILTIATAVFISKKELVAVACSAANLIMMCIFHAAVKGWVKKNYEDYLDVEPTAIFSLYIIICVVIILTVVIDKYVIKPGKLKAFLQEIK